MIDELIRLANHLDRIGLIKEADYLDQIVSTANPSEKEGVNVTVVAKKTLDKNLGTYDAEITITVDRAPTSFFGPINAQIDKL